MNFAESPFSSIDCLPVMSNKLTDSGRVISKSNTACLPHKKIYMHTYIQYII